MTKLEQCVRLMSAIDEGSRVTISYHRDRGFDVTAEDSNEGYLSSGNGQTLDDAITVMHRDLSGAAELLRKALETFEGK